VTDKIRSLCGPLIMGRREKAEIEVTDWDLEHFGDLVLRRTNSEKGSTRKHTGNWVTSWTNVFWRNSGISR
jgi:hypothetical protein